MGLGLRGLGFRGLGFRGLGFRADPESMLIHIGSLSCLFWVYAGDLFSDLA